MAAEGGDKKLGGRQELNAEMKKLDIEFSAAVEHPEVNKLDLSLSRFLRPATWVPLWLIK